MMGTDDYRLLFCTCPDQDTGNRIASHLVSEGLAACVNLLPGLTSVYRWQGALHEDSEVLLLIKTTANRLPALTETLRELHPYDVPEIIAVPIVAGLPDYLQWVTQCTRTDD